LSIGALLGGLSLAQPLDARDTQIAGARDSVVPIVVIDAPSQESPGRAQQADNQSAAKAKEATPGFDIATDGAGYFLTQLSDVPLAAWVLLATCVLCAGLRATRAAEVRARRRADIHRTGSNAKSSEDQLDSAAAVAGMKLPAACGC